MQIFADVDERVYDYFGRGQTHEMMHRSARLRREGRARLADVMTSDRNSA